MVGLGSGQVCWLGGQVDKPGGTWSWVTGEPWSYTHWAKWKGRSDKGEPSGLDPAGKPETVLAFGLFPNFATPPDLCDVAPDHASVCGLLIEWED